MQPLPQYLAVSHYADPELCDDVEKGKLLPKSYLLGELSAWAGKRYWLNSKLRREPKLDRVFGPETWRYLLRENLHAIVQITSEVAYIHDILPYDKYVRLFVK
ncbi:MAG: hypothetical protein HRF49_10890 [bacterium]|jgi:hypothetical protein